MICKRVTYFTDLEIIEYYLKMCGWNSKSLKTKNYVTNYARYATLKKSFLMVYIGTYDCYENIKTKLWSTISILKPWHYKILTTKRKWLQSLTKFCKFCNLLFYLPRDNQTIYYFSWLNRLISYHFNMLRMYIRKASSEQD